MLLLLFYFFWFCSLSLPSRTNIYSNYSPLFLLLPSRRRKGGEVSRVVGALLLPSFSPSLFLSPTPLSTSKRRGGSARGRRASPPLLFSVSFSFFSSPLDVEKEGRSRAWSARFSSPPFLPSLFSSSSSSLHASLLYCKLLFRSAKPTESTHPTTVRN